VPDPSTISVSGRGEVTAVPDIAVFSMTLSAEASEVKVTQDSLSKKTAEILQALENFGFEKKDIKTLSYNIYPRYEYYEKQRICPENFSCPPSFGERVLVGYEANQTISVKIREIEKAGEVLEILGGYGVSNISGPNFDIENKEELLRQARKMAIDDAKEKAKALSKDLGVKLSGIQSFFEGDNYRYTYSKTASFEEAFAEDGGIAPEIPVGQNEIISSIEIIYKIK